jgi:hypothetical protein
VEFIREWNNVPNLGDYRTTVHPANPSASSKDKKRRRKALKEAK